MTDKQQGWGCFAFIGVSLIIGQIVWFAVCEPNGFKTLMRVIFK